jgi:hypothetical protein
MLRKAKLEPLFTTSCKQDRWLHLADVTDFVTTEDMRLNLLEARDMIQRVLIIGAYAVPLSIAELQSKAGGEAGLAESAAAGETR